MLPPRNDRRRFLTGDALRHLLEYAGDQFLATAHSEEPAEDPLTPLAGPTLRLGKSAMACDFDIVLNPGPADQLAAASAALDLIDLLEDQLTVYRPNSELSRFNAAAHAESVPLEPRLFDLLTHAAELSLSTGGAFDPTSGPLIALWRACRAADRLPSADELAIARSSVGVALTSFDPQTHSARFLRPGVEWNLGSIGKGYALDRALDLLREYHVDDCLLHAGFSSLRAAGSPAGSSRGWPVGIRNPLLPHRRLALLSLHNAALSTSGNGAQYFRHAGRKYGHLLDPRTGWPAEGLLAVSVAAPTAALADALSTAFFVMGVEKAWAYCHNHNDLRVLIIPAPDQGRRLRPVVWGFDPADLSFAPDDVADVEWRSPHEVSLGFETKE